LRAVGGILQYYDSDKSIPAYGFGATFPRYFNPKSAFHKFALNGDCFKPDCNGIGGVEKAYLNAIQQSRLYGPTNFGEIIDEINQRLE
jgi:hypothetical protein